MLDMVGKRRSELEMGCQSAGRGRLPSSGSAFRGYTTCARLQLGSGQGGAPQSAVGQEVETTASGASDNTRADQMKIDLVASALPPQLDAIGHYSSCLARALTKRAQ